MTKQKWLLAAAAAAVVAVVGAGAVMAQSTPQAGGTSFLDRVAQKLGIETPKLQDAIKSARTDQIDEAVKNGDLTQKQADALKQKVQNSNPDGFGPGLHGDFKGGKSPGPGAFGKGEFGFGLGTGLADAGQKLADFLGIPLAQLQTELQAANATLASVAQAHGKTRDDLKTFIRDTAKSTLDQQVQNQDITQKVEDQILQNLDSRLDQLIDGKFGFGHGRGRGLNDREGDETPVTPTTPAPPGGSNSGASLPF